MILFVLRLHQIRWMDNLFVNLEAHQSWSQRSLRDFWLLGNMWYFYFSKLIDCFKYYKFYLFRFLLKFLLHNYLLKFITKIHLSKFKKYLNTFNPNGLVNWCQRKRFCHFGCWYIQCLLCSQNESKLSQLFFLSITMIKYGISMGKNSLPSEANILMF